MTSTVILGSGIIGLSTAYYLSQHQPGSSIHLVDSSPQLFASASGFAGGFVARDWFQASVASLGALSFREHERVASEESGFEKWGYAKTTTVSYSPGVGPSSRRKGGGKNWLEEGGSRADVLEESGGEEEEDGDVPPWLRRSKGDSLDVMNSDGGTAIVDPLRLCQFLLSKCKEAGVQVHHPATALSIGKDMRDELSSVTIGYTDSSTETEIPATRLLLSAGAWTPQVFSTLFRSSPIEIPVSAYAGHSLVVRNPRIAGGDRHHAVYTSFSNLSPEIYSRPNGVIYLAGLNSSSTPLPRLATGVQPVQSSVNELMAVAEHFIAAPGGGDLEIVRKGLCFRPVTRRGSPILTRLEEGQLGPDIRTRPGADGGVFVAVGHGPWGISLSLGTGKVMAEMMQGRTVSADVGWLGL